MELRRLDELDNGNVAWTKRQEQVIDMSKVRILDTWVVPEALANKPWSIAEVLNYEDSIDLLLEFNGLDPFSIPAGTEIKIPVLDDLQNARLQQTQSLTGEQTDGSSSNKKTAKGSIVKTENGRLIFSAKQTK